ncbi:MAG: hypothetical protein A3F78_13540 [Burkholderiales bacterium RIFCSPLOWO2_12_FULL_61_40]|nr:MAG: hypothetical protein A3F78_13540 [Burkholderiales bacterium RIFCSPLOWO2_12_FULL_61_40]
MVRTSSCAWRRFALLALAWLFLWVGGVGTATAAPALLNNDDLSEVTGRDGISIVVHLEVNTSDTSSDTAGARFTRSFMVNGTTTYATAQGLRGVVDLVGLTVDVKARGGLNDGSYIDIGLPGVVAANQFGFRSFGVQTDAQAAVPAEQNFGGVLLHGLATQTGHFLMWAK